MAPTPDRDLYAALGLGTDASTIELRRAYRALALQLHPDRNPDPAAAGRFRAVTAAYAVLADPVRRADYDASRATPSTAAAPAPDPAAEPGR
ncbi:MAG: J domain-containing protein, partial [Microlunatus sp.]|nr:J domain-containing protein [Microlunatus sp.]